MNGIDATSGKRLSGLAHLRQSITDILTTPIGARVMRRDYGSRLYELVDAPLNRATLLDIFAATAEALDTWEPRLEVEDVKAERLPESGVVLSMRALYRPTGERVVFDGIEIA